MEDGGRTFRLEKGGAELESGYTAKTVLAGCDGANDTPAYFMRADFNVDSLEGMTQLLGTLQYDDGVILYINGQRVAAFDDNACNAGGASLNHGFDAICSTAAVILTVPAAALAGAAAMADSRSDGRREMIDGVQKAARRK